MKKIIFTLSIAMLSIGTFAQIGGGLRTGYDIYLGGTGLKTPSVGLFATFAKSDQILIRGGFQYGIPIKYTETYSAHALSSATDPQYISVNGETKIGTFNIYADGLKYFGDGDNEDGGLYGSLGVGLTIASDQTTYDNYDNMNYSVTGFSNEGAKETYIQPMIRAYGGYDILLSSLHLFGELGVSIPAASTNSRTGSTAVLPAFFELSIGVRL